MSIIKKISSKYNVYGKDIASSKESIEEISKFSTILIPDDYIELLNEATDIRISIEDAKDIMIWGVDRCIEMNDAYEIQQYIPKSLAIGDDGHGNALIYATGERGFGLYVIAFNDLDIHELQYVAGSLSDLLINNVGIDIITSC